MDPSRHLIRRLRGDPNRRSLGKPMHQNSLSVALEHQTGTQTDHSYPLDPVPLVVAAGSRFIPS